MSFGEFLVYAVLVLTMGAGYIFCLSWLVMALYGGLVPEEWVRPTHLQWAGILIVLMLLFGGSTKAT